MTTELLHNNDLNVMDNLLVFMFYFKTKILEKSKKNLLGSPTYHKTIRSEDISLVL